LHDVDPHSALAATLLGVSYDDFIKRKKEPRFKYARQASKPFSFGKPGGMGDVKLVLQQRKQGPDTPCPNGPVMIDDGDGNLVPGYRGLRFCVLMDGAERCGVRKTTTYRDRMIPPTCEHCIECANRLGRTWKQQWSENSRVFDMIADFVDNGMVIQPESLERWPWLKEVFVPWQHLNPGEVMQHVTGRIRNVATSTKESPFCSAANGFFQGMLSDISKAAYRRVTRECYDATVRIPAQQYHNSKRSQYVGCGSPLLGSRAIAFFHDELFLEHPESIAADAAERASEIMIEEMAWYCPDVAATCGAEPTLMRAWNKSAECVRDENGRLQVWEPKR